MKNKPFRFSIVIALLALFATANVSAQPAAPSHPKGQPAAKHTFAIGENDFLLDGKPFVIRTGEMHFTRVPREYWRHRLQMLKAMGMNAVCAYLFWNYHEFEQGHYNWAGQADAAEFCRMAQEEGLWVVLRPGPYVCAEWDGGGLPWWLLKEEDIKLRTLDPRFMAAARAWFMEVGRVLGPLQVTRGGPILMAQVENEYGSYGKDSGYIAALRQQLIEAGFNVPFFVCNPAGDLRNGTVDGLFNVVNFGRDAAGGFARLRQIQRTGPLMCGEFYPGWFDTWGVGHHYGKTQQYLEDFEYMLKNRASFSLYMAHGGTTPGMFPGVDRPFKPDTNSYDYDAPISEAAWVTEKFTLTRDLVSKYLEPGETLPAPPAPMPVGAIAPFTLTQFAPVFGNLPAAIVEDAPRNMEAYDQGHGCTLYRTTIPAGPTALLQCAGVHDFAWVFLDGKQIAVMDRRSRHYSVQLPARDKPARLEILVEAMGHVNFGVEIHDRKGLHGPVTLVASPTDMKTLAGAKSWQVYPLPLDEPMLSALKWQPAKAATSMQTPAFWLGTFNVETPADTFLDFRTWGKGVMWINGRCISRFWNIGPTQTAYVPGVWLKRGQNEIVILDLVGPREPVVAGLEKPILDEMHPELDFAPAQRDELRSSSLMVSDKRPIAKGIFASGSDVQEVKFLRLAKGRQFCLQSLSAHDGGPFAAIAELDLLDAAGNSISHVNWKIVYVDSEELSAEDGSVSNAIDGQTNSIWHTQWKARQPGHPHSIVIDLGGETEIAGFRYTPRPGSDTVPGRIREYQVFIGDALVISK